MRSAILGLGLAAFLGCPKASEVVVVDAAIVVVEVVDAGPIDAGPPIPASLEPIVSAGLADGGSLTVTPPKAEIDPATTLTVALPIKLKDFRIRLLDWRDQIVVSDDELLADGRTYLLTLKEPLKAGRGYTLVLDAELGPIVTDEAGGTFNDWELAFRISGDVAPDPSAPKKKKKR